MSDKDDDGMSAADGCMLILVVLGLALAIPCFLDSGYDGGDGETGSGSSSGRYVHSSMAWSTCKDAVRSKLKAPSTAKFAPLTEVKGGPEASDKQGVWILNGHVDAENAFGAKLRKNAVCKLKKTGDTFEVIRAGLSDR